MIFIDTGALVGWFAPRDEHHSASIATWNKIGKGTEPCLTSNFVLDETLTLLARRTSYAFAADRARYLYGSAVLSIVRPTLDDELAALEDFVKFADQRVSFTDAVSFALLRRERVRRVFTFDRHFRLAGFEVIP